ncbi:MAG: hypothetical protein E6Q88_04575 [Lysobacteraceae bacterium]|nr:MAG: hypothetical protein E6Q88_04575 [Xanthomonadaceae bacterium]
MEKSEERLTCQTVVTPCAAVRIRHVAAGLLPLRVMSAWQTGWPRSDELQGYGESKPRGRRSSISVMTAALWRFGFQISFDKSLFFFFINGLHIAPRLKFGLSMALTCFSLRDVFIALGTSR